MTNKDELKQQLADHIEKCGEYSKMGDKDKEIHDDLKEQIKKMEEDEVAAKEDITHDPEKEKTETENTTPVPEAPPEPENPNKEQYTERRCGRCRKKVKFEGELMEQQFCEACKKIRAEGEPILNEHNIPVGKQPPQI